MSSFKDKLYHYETPPPAQAWDNIAAALDQGNLTDKFPSTLREMEVAPPSAAWDRINATLNSETAKPAPAKIRRMPLIRYAAAAAVIGAIAFAIIRLSGSSTDIETLASGNNNSNDTVAKNESTSNEIASAPAATDNDETENETPVTSDQEKKLLARLERPTHSRKTSVPNISSNNVSNSLYTYEDHVPSIADRYIMLMTPDGNFIRMSKKWSNMVCCVSGEEQDADCKDQLKKWQEKLAQSSISSDNVLDMLTLVNSLDDGSDLY